MRRTCHGECAGMRFRREDGDTTLKPRSEKLGVLHENDRELSVAIRCNPENPHNTTARGCYFLTQGDRLPSLFALLHLNRLLRRRVMLPLRERGHSGCDRDSVMQTAALKNGGNRFLNSRFTSPGLLRS